ncbi:DMT family transporter [Azospirillum picis]|uniref:Drug/metabolite transporter (DMT)-like permease n=1 Tax=Azospirillum picis TaxID=488438 RepID=A0ABU0MDG0_9PROT|nr:DMT family transporter [Azospirillum picis]MBP2297510.1 drug/metabolite transporter (DMT)-like permease [Azospirillum picis]MDQ0531467.1 drug/metabolite transporter (DMT)-like permease [Azospirillum picis]
MAADEKVAGGAGAGRPGASGILRPLLLTALAMLAFAANSVLCRLALTQSAIDPASFTLVRIASGAASLWLIARATGHGAPGWGGGSWAGAAALLAYAAAFSFAYVTMTAGTGALLLFGAVQATMVLAGLKRGERLVPMQWAGLTLALAGLALLLAPGLSAPDPLGALLMVVAGVAWGAYSLLGRTSRDHPVATTAGNFLRAAPAAAALALLAAAAGGLTIGTGLRWDGTGLLYAVLSGAFASGAGYSIWYAALPALTAARAASVQLSVPVITAMVAILALGEPLTLSLLVSSAAVLGGIGLVIAGRRTGGR